MKKRRRGGWGAGSEISAFIGLGTDFKGELTFEGVIRLDGRFSGKIKSNGTLIIGDTANVTAEIDVDTVVVSGEVHGNILARNRVEFHAPAKHFGNLCSPIVIIDEGVVFEGHCRMAEAGGNLDKKITLITKEGESRVDQENI